MDFRQAKNLLSDRPLLFGDDEQIKAVKWLNAVGLALDFRKEQDEICQKCDGDGELDCHCSSCGDEHTKHCPECDGTGVDNVESFGTQDAEVVQAAKEIKKSGWPMKVA